MARHVAHEDITLIANRKNVKNRRKMLGYFCKFSTIDFGSFLKLLENVYMLRSSDNNFYFHEEQKY